MDTSALRKSMVTVAVSFAAGFGVHWYIQGPEAAVSAAATPAPAPTAPLKQFGDAWSPLPAAAPVAALRKDASVDELWSRALAPQGTQDTGYDAEDRLRQLAQSNPVALRSLLQRYDSAPTPQARALLKSVLATVQAPDVVAFSNRLANSSNTADRKYGFELLQNLAPDAPETRSLVRHALANEQSPEVLVQALDALRPGAVDPDETALVVTQLKSLVQHADPAVRSQSITQLGQWDKKGEGADSLSLALADRAPEVRSAAVFAIAQTGVRSDAVKAALMGLVNNAQENKDVRGSAMQVLERFSLSKEDLASFAQARTQMRGL